MNKIYLIIKREYLTRVRKKSFIIMTILDRRQEGLDAGAAAYLTNPVTRTELLKTLDDVYEQ